uniref:DUF4239 domain-containing protein n=1 Tax=Rhodopseudomonas palustris (strain BisA53) TaxID=316055 RepID=Q07PS9_RHOP5
MIRAWLDLDTFGTFATLAVLYFGIAAALVVLVFVTPLGPRIKSLTGVIGPFVSCVAILFGLTTSFLGYDIVERNRQATRAVQSEAGELQNLYALSIASVTDMKKIRIALKAYIGSVLHDEWPQIGGTSGSSAPRTDAAYDELLGELSDPSISRDASATVHAAMLNSALRVGTARNTRLSLSADRTGDLKWISVLILGIITQVALAVVHLEKWRAMSAALTIFSSAAIIALGMIALQEDPFGGMFQVSPAPLQRLVSLPDYPLPPTPEAAASATK